MAENELRERVRVRRRSSIVWVEKDKFKLEKWFTEIKKERETILRNFNKVFLVNQKWDNRENLFLEN